jgi:hypothetical protein
MRRVRPSAWVPVLPMALYLGSWLLPCGFRGADFGDGFKFLFIGIMRAHWWAANPLLWIGTDLLYRGQALAACWCGTVATVLAFSEFVESPELTTSPCHWGWFLSMIILALAALIARFFPNSKDKELEELQAEVAALCGGLKREEAFEGEKC